MPASIADKTLSRDSDSKSNKKKDLKKILESTLPNTKQETLKLV